MPKIVSYRQLDGRDCGPTCLRIIAKYYGRSLSLEKLLRISETTREGSSIKNLTDAAKKIGFNTMGVKISFEKLQAGIPLPCIVFWQQRHFVVVYKIKGDVIWLADPAHGKIKVSKDEFIQNWIGQDATASEKSGIAILLEDTPKVQITEPDDLVGEHGASFLLKYLRVHKKLLVQLFIGLLAGSVLQFLFPFLTQSIIDVGIQNYDLHFIYLILIAQLSLFFGRITIDILRDWILLHLSTRINISLVSDFFIKLMNLPISFFDSKITGDIMQRIKDHSTIEKLLTSTTLNTFFSFVNIVVFGLVLFLYNGQVFLVFLIGSGLYFIWITLFLKKRRDLNYKRFTQLSSEQSKMMELVNGMQEIKLHNAEKESRWSWEYLQARLFKIEMQNLALQQTQAVGANVINELKNIFITVLSAKLVIDGEITLGVMIAIAYIIGQLNGPLQQLIGFIYSLQDAKIALERLAQIHNRKDEEEADSEKIQEIPDNADLHIKNVSFRYKGALRNVIQDLSLVIPANKTTAIVGASGSGKTTLLKLILKFYEPTEGGIVLDTINLNNIQQRSWRNHCGVVMQEGYLFNDSIAQNITIGNERIDRDRLHQAVKIANAEDFIGQLPMGLETKIGSEGLSLSTGQKQRILIARTVYKNPRMILFDEATSALDAKNERTIVENLNTFFRDRTAVVIAHRLSTVRNADQIVVFEKGQIVEIGRHEDLVVLKGAYYNLIKNQLDLEKLTPPGKNSFI